MADSLGPLKDWQSGDEIAATDLQAFADRLRGFPITFTGNVTFYRDAGGGMHVHIPGGPLGSPQLPLLHITDEANGGGNYVARVVTLPDTWDETADLNLSSLVDGVDNVLFVNLQENGGSTHWLTDAANTNQRYLTPDARWPMLDSQGRTIYVSNAAWFAPCPTPTPSPTPPP